MRKVMLLLPAMVAACSTAPAAIPIHGVTPGHQCIAESTDQFVGQPATSDTGAAILRATDAAVLRWAPMGMMLTMDFREDRVTVHLGPDNKIIQIKCG